MATHFSTRLVHQAAVEGVDRSAGLIASFVIGRSSNLVGLLIPLGALPIANDTVLPAVGTGPSDLIVC
jgi:hypothetical protein